MKKTLTAHCLVKNEERFIWYSVMSVINHVDQVLLWDTGSSDDTLKIIKEIQKADKEGKVKFKQYGEVTKETFAKARQDMLNETKTDWFMVVDGDEIWWEDSIKKVVELVKTSKTHDWESIIVPTYNLVGDFYHYLPQDAGLYSFKHSNGVVKGHYNLRLVNTNIPGIHSEGEHGVWGWADERGKQIQDRNPSKILFIDAPYIHATFLQRAKTKEDEKKVPKRGKKLKYELGQEFPLDFYYPEVLFRKRPKIVHSVWNKRDILFTLKATVQTPLKKVRRKILSPKVGY